jgi:hypothetical protein
MASQLLDSELSKIDRHLSAIRLALEESAIRPPPSAKDGNEFSVISYLSEHSVKKMSLNFEDLTAELTEIDDSEDPKIQLKQLQLHFKKLEEVITAKHASDPSFDALEHRERVKAVLFHVGEIEVTGISNTEISKELLRLIATTIDPAHLAILEKHLVNNSAVHDKKPLHQVLDEAVEEMTFDIDAGLPIVNETLAKLRTFRELKVDQIMQKSVAADSRLQD